MYHVVSSVLEAAVTARLRLYVGTRPASGPFPGLREGDAHQKQNSCLQAQPQAQVQQNSNSNSNTCNGGTDKATEVIKVSQGAGRKKGNVLMAQQSESSTATVMVQAAKPPDLVQAENSLEALQPCWQACTPFGDAKKEQTHGVVSVLHDRTSEPANALTVDLLHIASPERPQARPPLRLKAGQLRKWLSTIPHTLLRPEAAPPMLSVGDKLQPCINQTPDSSCILGTQLTLDLQNGGQAPFPVPVPSTALSLR